MRRHRGDSLLQAKGRRYTLTELLASQPWAARFDGGSFATIYLAPFNYHRIHMPLADGCSIPSTCRDAYSA
jgi:phosphatidylserine decarboxylase